MQLEESAVAAESVYGESKFVFCCEGCRRLFEESPVSYAPESRETRSHSFELAIVGGGPAALTAGVYAAIQRIPTLVVTENIGGQAVDSTHIGNYMGFDFITGKELVAKFRDQLIRGHFVEHRLARVTAIRPAEGAYDLTTEYGELYRARAVLIATGMSPRRLDVPGEARLERRGVSYAGVQDAARFHGADVAIAGGGNSALQAAVDLAVAARTIYVVARGELTADAADVEKLRALPQATVLTHSAIQEISGSDRVEAIRVQNLKDGQTREIPVAGVFIAIGFVTNSSFVASLVERSAAGEIVIGPDCSTSAPGVFAAGDVTTAFGKRIVVAAGEGAKAALAAFQYLSRTPVPS
jgi:alkyl hydroperoxide reductase subunit F